MAIRQFTIDNGVWDRLTEDQRAVLETWFYAAHDDLRRQLDLQDKQQVQDDMAGGDIQVVNWSQEERNSFREIAAKAWEETAAKSPEARKVLDAYYAFMKQIRLLQ